MDKSEEQSNQLFLTVRSDCRKIRKVQYHVPDNNHNKKKHLSISQIETFCLGFFPSHPGEPRSPLQGIGASFHVTPFAVSTDFCGSYSLQREDHIILRQFPESINEIDSHVCFKALHLQGVLVYDMAFGKKKNRAYFQISLKIKGSQYSLKGHPNAGF